MLSGTLVRASYEKTDKDIELTVGTYRLSELEYPFVLVKPVNN